jgi:hypothetical protein
MPRWSKALIEWYNADGYQGLWEGTPNPERGGWDPADLPRLARHIRADMQFAQAILQYCDDGDTLVIAVFDGVEPPPGPRRGTAFVPDTFEEHM